MHSKQPSAAWPSLMAPIQRSPNRLLPMIFLFGMFGSRVLAQTTQTDSISVAQIMLGNNRVSLLRTGGEMVLEVTDEKGSVLFRSDPLGPDPRNLPTARSDGPLALHDITEDGEDEILVGTSDGRGTGLLHVFTAARPAPGYRVIPYLISASLGQRDFLVWDALDAETAPLELLKGGLVKLPGRIFDATGERPPSVVSFVYGYRKNHLILLGESSKLGISAGPVLPMAAVTGADSQSN